MKSRVLAFVALTCSTLLLTQCDDGSVNAKIKGLRDEIEQLNHQNYETQQQVTRLQSQIEASRAERKKLEEEKAKVEADRESAAKQLDQLKRDFETYKSKYKLSMRERAPGMKVNDFTSAEGKSYKNVVLKEINESQVNFTHDGGVMRLHFSQLPLTLQDMLGFLIQDKPQPKEVKILSPKQQNAQARIDHEVLVTAAENAVESKRLEKAELNRKLSEAKAAEVEAKNIGYSGYKEGQLVKSLEHLVKQIEGEILKAELDLHEARIKPVKQVPER